MCLPYCRWISWRPALFTFAANPTRICRYMGRRKTRSLILVSITASKPWSPTVQSTARRDECVLTAARLKSKVCRCGGSEARLRHGQRQERTRALARPNSLGGANLLLPHSSHFESHTTTPGRARVSAQHAQCMRSYTNRILIKEVNRNSRGPGKAEAAVAAA